MRDFTHAKDVAEANVLVLEKTPADHVTLNVGTGRPTSILDLANTVIELYGADLNPEIPGTYRKDDIRHCFADASKASDHL